jgi:hypothetical protein
VFDHVLLITFFQALVAVTGKRALVLDVVDNCHCRNTQGVWLHIRTIIQGVFIVSVVNLVSNMAMIVSIKFCTSVSCSAIINDLAGSCTNVMLIKSIAGATAYVMIHHRSDGINSGCLF